MVKTHPDKRGGKISFGKIKIGSVEQKVNQTNPGSENVLSGFVERQVGYEVIYLHACGGRVWRHELMDVRGIDHESVLEIAIDKANAGHEVPIMPIILKDHPLRKSVFENAKANKCPDLKINGRYTEIKTLTNLHQQKISTNIKVAHAQADDVIINLKEQFDLQILTRISKGRFRVHRRLNLVEFKIEGQYYSFRRSDFL